MPWPVTPTPVTRHESDPATTTSEGEAPREEKGAQGDEGTEIYFTTGEHYTSPTLPERRLRYYAQHLRLGFARKIESVFETS